MIAAGTTKMIINRKASRKIIRVKPISNLRMVLVIGTVSGISLIWGTIVAPRVFAQELRREAGNVTDGNVTDGNTTASDIAGSGMATPAIMIPP
jgi:hypothetical protein